MKSIRILLTLAAIAAATGICHAAASFETEIQGTPEQSPDYRAIAIRLLEERCALLKAFHGSTVIQYESGTCPSEDLWRAREAWDLGRVQLLRYRETGFTAIGIPEALLQLKAAEACRDAQKDAILPENVHIKYELAVNQARIRYLELWQSCPNLSAWKEAAAALKDYPYQPATDEQLAALVAAENASE